MDTCLSTAVTILFHFMQMLISYFNLPRQAYLKIVNYPFIYKLVTN